MSSSKQPPLTDAKPFVALAVHDVSSEDPLALQMDGGLWAWLSVLASFIIHFLVFGPMYSIGISVTYLKTIYPAEQSKVSLVSSLSLGMLFLLAFLSGRLADTFGYRRMAIIGTLFITAGQALAGSATALWHLFLTQGLMFGLGCSLIFFPGLSLPSQWWDKRRAFATGVGVSGAGAGGVVMSLLVPIMLKNYGYSWMMRIQSIASFIFLMIACAAMKTRLPNTGSLRGPLIDMNTLRNIRFIPLFIAYLIIPFGYQVPIYFMSDYVHYVGLPTKIIPSLFVAFNASSMVGRVMGGFMGELIGRLNGFVIAQLCLGLSTWSFWLFSGASQGMLYTYMISFGFSAGAFMSLIAPVIAQLIGVQGLASKVGLLYTANAIGNFAGPYLADAIVGKKFPFVHPGSAQSTPSGLFPSQAYGWAIIHSGALMLTASIIIFMLRFVIVNKRIFVRV